VGSGLLRRLWRDDRLALAVCAVGSALAAICWRATTRPMGDTPTYRATAAILRDGWPSLTDRGPGYPLLLLLTGSSGGSTHLLFVVQLAMHVLCVLLVIDLARRAHVGRHGRAVLAALLFAPAVLLRVVYEGSEGLTALLLTATLWLLLTRPKQGRQVPWALGLGALCGGLALVRPNFALVFVPVAVLASVPLDRDRWRTAGLVALPALVIVGSYSLANGIRFDSYGLTPLTPYHLSSKTAPYVEELPASYEPARTVLIEERDAALLRGESMAPDNFIWVARPRLEDATGLEGRALDRYLMEIDLHLITHHPIDYADTVQAASLNYTTLDSQPAILGLGRPAAWLQRALHDLLLLTFVAVLACIPGLAIAGRVGRDRLWPIVAGLALAAYGWLSVVTFETGTARLRAPTEPILALVLVIAASTVRAQLQARRIGSPERA
jgi:hypothetical protein